jgi:hydroxyethylthiazole kinase
MTASDMLTADAVADSLAALRARPPLVHSITSAVVANFTANALLAIGAAPAMVESPDEIPDFTASSDALVINLGMLTPPRAAAMRLAVETAGRTGRPWVLDPVGAGAIPARTAFAQALCALRPTAIRGNASEIRGLAGQSGQGRGVDSRDASGTAIAAASELASRTGAIVAVSGAVDYVTDGTILAAVANGHPMMTRVTGMGCAATAIVGAWLGSGMPPLVAVAHAMTITALAGEIAAAHAAGPGSLAMSYLDALYTMDAGQIRRSARLRTQPGPLDGA